MLNSDLKALAEQFLQEYNATVKDAEWQLLSQQFRSFWRKLVQDKDQRELSQAECDPIIRILDRNGRGNTANSEAVARTMVPQGRWYGMFDQLKGSELGRAVDRILTESDPSERATAIDHLYQINTARNFLTGKTGNVINAMLAAYDPQRELSIISLQDRQTLLAFLSVPYPEADTIGTRITRTTACLITALQEILGPQSARTLSRFCYWLPMQDIWKGAVGTARRENRLIEVTIPTDEPEDVAEATEPEGRESIKIQSALAKIGAAMGFTIWLPKADRTAVCQHWSPEPNILVESLPLNYEQLTLKTIEAVDVLWLRNRYIVRAFEVEHTTSVYSGILRMADLLALQPNMAIRLHLVAPEARRDKVFQEISRPVFSLLEGRSLSDICTYLSYDSVYELLALPHLRHCSDALLEEYEEPVTLQ